MKIENIKFDEIILKNTTTGEQFRITNTGSRYKISEVINNMQYVEVDELIFPNAVSLLSQALHEMEWA